MTPRLLLRLTPERMTRSRFSAYALGDTDYVWRTWHPSTRPEEVSPDADIEWTRLEIVETVGDVVEFRAHCTGEQGPGVLRERSRFSRRAGRWFYLDGEVG